MQEILLREAMELLKTNKDSKVAVFTTANPWFNMCDKPVIAIVKQEKSAKYPRPGYLLKRSDNTDTFSLVGRPDTRLYVSYNYPSEISTNHVTAQIALNISKLLDVKAAPLVFLFRNKHIDVNQEIREMRASINVLIERKGLNLQTYYNVLTDYIRRQDSFSTNDVDNLYDVLVSLKETIAHINRKAEQPTPDITDFIE